MKNGVIGNTLNPAGKDQFNRFNPILNAGPIVNQARIVFNRLAHVHERNGQNQATAWPEHGENSVKRLNAIPYNMLKYVRGYHHVRPVKPVSGGASDIQSRTLVQICIPVFEFTFQPFRISRTIR